MLIPYDTNNKSKCNQTVLQGSKPPTTGNVEPQTLRTYQACRTVVNFQRDNGLKVP